MVNVRSNSSAVPQNPMRDSVTESDPSSHQRSGPLGSMPRHTPISAPGGNDDPVTARSVEPATRADEGLTATTPGTTPTGAVTMVPGTSAASATAMTQRGAATVQVVGTGPSASSGSTVVPTVTGTSKPPVASVRSHHTFGYPQVVWSVAPGAHCDTVNQTSGRNPEPVTVTVPPATCSSGATTTDPRVAGGGGAGAKPIRANAAESAMRSTAATPMPHCSAGSAQSTHRSKAGM